MKPLPLFAAGINTGTLIGITVINNTVNTVNQAIRNVSCLHLNPIHPGDQLWATHLQLEWPSKYRSRGLRICRADIDLLHKPPRKLSNFDGRVVTTAWNSSILNMYCDERAEYSGVPLRNCRLPTF